LESSISKEQLQIDPKYDVVIVLGGNIRETENRGYVSTSFVEGPEKSIGAHSRALAAAELYKKGEARKFITSTGHTHPNPNAPSEAQVMKDEMARYGVPPEAIILEDVSLSTLENAKECAKVIKEKDFKKIAVLTNSFHLARSKAMFESLGLKDEGRELSFLSSEKILAKKSPRHEAIIRKVYGSQSMKERIKMEKKGIEDFRAGRYKSKPI